MEWLVLLVLVAATVVPIVLLYGFAGCSFNPRLAVGVPEVTATAKNVDHISVTWENTDTTFEVTGYRFVRKLGPVVQMDREVEASPTSLEDTGLEPPLQPDADYTYEVSAITDGGRSEAGTAVASTFGIALAVDPATRQDQTVAPDNYCFVHRIAAAQLLADGGKVGIKIQGAPAGNVTINAVYISRVPGAGNPWDSFGDLKPVLTSALTLPNDSPVDLDPIDYALDQTRDLIVAFDFTAAAGAGNLRFAAAPGVTLFFKQGVQQADLLTRDADFITQPDPRLYFAVTIGVS